VYGHTECGFESHAAETKYNLIRLFWLEESLKLGNRDRFPTARYVTIARLATAAKSRKELKGEKKNV
jgi:hypothetical protein